MLLLSFFIVNCSGKRNTPNKPPKIIRPTPQVATQSVQPSLGRVISRPTPSPRPTVEHNSRNGETHFREKFKLPKSIQESSGLIKIDNRLWTLNDSGGKAALYQIDESNGRIVKTLNILNARNYDWEDLAYDDTYVYIGDFGNNRGNRRDLRVYKIPRASLRTQKSVRAEVIDFKYSDQKDFSSKPHKNDYDCEAMIAHKGKLYLFSKNWQNKKTRLYALSTQKGKHMANYISTFNTQGMVTGASMNHELDILLLTTYSSLLHVNVWAFTNYRGTNLFNGNAKRLSLKKPLEGQIEGVTFNGNYKAYLSSEAFKKYIFSFDPTLYELDFSSEFE